MVSQRKETDIVDQNITETQGTVSAGNLDFTAGNAYTDVAVEGLSKQVADSSSQVVAAEDIIALDRAATSSNEDVDKKAENFLVTRNPATYAVGSEVFFKRFAPSATYPIPIGTVVTTLPGPTGEFVSFITTAYGEINPSTPVNPSTGRWEVTIPVIAQTVGLAGTAGRNSVTRLLFPVVGIDGAINPASIVSGAADEETNTELTNRIRTEKTAKNLLGTRTGYQTFIVENFPASLHADVVGPKDPVNRRAEFGNEIDIYIEGQNPQPFVDQVSYDGTTNTYLLTHPTLTVSSVVGITTSIVYVENVNWVFVQDTSPGYGFSVKALDKLSWIGARPSLLEALAITGTYEQNVVDVQTYLTDPVRRVVATNLLVKNGQKVFIDISVRISVLGGYDRNTLISNVKTAITNYINVTLVLGSRIEQADLVAIIGAVQGVDEVQIPFTVLKKSTEPPLTVHDIGLSRNQFPVINTSTLTVEVI